MPLINLILIAALWVCGSAAAQTPATRVMEPDDLVLSVVLKPGVPRNNAPIGAHTSATETTADAAR